MTTKLGEEFTEMESARTCEMCGHEVFITQDAHIIAERKMAEDNVLRLCPTCHLMFDTHLKPRIFAAMKNAGVLLPLSWEKSIYHQAAEASAKQRARAGGKP